ncbi:YbfB/YjiJ family MFS transporter [Alicyclobacillus suci]|uniref:YbfB/YjiJ family MFS transporter n=1 Tax=Alicyclobacillus suci TaxID=2816080 RepID=UPI001A8F384F|nr:YbfB/YjiJ family MFS transporter [Alicyclobacillus suci]
MRDLLYVTLGGILALAIAMGIGRFAYTPIFPLMQVAQHFSEAAAGCLAASNYLGYLVGALSASAIQWTWNLRLIFRVSLVINILSTGAMAATTSLTLWSIFRFISGLTSGVVFVLASSMTLDFLASRKKSTWSGVFYSGVGIGIVISGLLVPIFDRLYGWRGTWLGLMCLCFALSVAPLVWTRGSTESDASSSKLDDRSTNRNSNFFYWLLASYGMEGLGYIVVGTFLVDISLSMPATREVSSLSWVIAGIGAIPSTLFWAWLGKRYGNLKALIYAYLLQAVGIVIPVIKSNVIGILVAAFLFGGTFMGITTLAASLARNVYNRSNRAIGYLTTCYGIGQIVGPVPGALLEEQTHSYAMSLVGAAIVILLGAVLLVAGRYFSLSKIVRVGQGGESHVE